MKRSKIYFVESNVNFVKEKTNYRSALLSIDKKVCHEVYKNFSDLGKIAFTKDEKSENHLCLWGNLWDKEIDIDRGIYHLKMQIIEGDERYPNPSVNIISAKRVGELPSVNEENVVEEVNFLNFVATNESATAPKAEDKPQETTQEPDFLF